MFYIYQRYGETECLELVSPYGYHTRKYAFQVMLAYPGVLKPENCLIIRQVGEDKPPRFIECSIRAVSNGDMPF